MYNFLFIGCIDYLDNVFENIFKYWEFGLVCQGVKKTQENILNMAKNYISFFVCALGLAIHTGINIVTNLRHSNTIMERTVVNTFDEFPVVFKVRHNTSINMTFSKEQGYNTKMDFFDGWERTSPAKRKIKWT